MPPLPQPQPLHLHTPSSSQLRHDLIPAAVGASIGLFAILLGLVVFIVLWLRGTPRLRSSGAISSGRKGSGRFLMKKTKRKRRGKDGGGLEKIVEEGERDDEGLGADGEGRGGQRHGQGQEESTARTSDGETLPGASDAERGEAEEWEVVRSSSATQEVVEAVGRKGEARAWWRGGRRGTARGWWR